MKAKYILGIVAVSLSLASCENYFDEKYLNNGHPVTPLVKAMEYELSLTDYQSIANSAISKQIAAEQDSIKKTKNRYQKALARLAEDFCFNNYITPDKYVPAFLSNKYPQMDPGSIINLIYLSDDGLPQYLIPYNDAARLTMNNITDEDDIIALLPQPEEGQVIGVLYDGGKKEALFESKDGYVWTKAVFPSGVDMHLLPLEANEHVIKWLQVNYPYAVEDQEVVVMFYSDLIGGYGAYEYVYSLGEWNANIGIVEETMMFVLNEKKEWVTDLSTYYKQAVAGEGMGSITLYHYDLQEGITYIWKYDNSYGMKGTAYAGGPHSGEGWFVTPKIKLKNSISPALSFEHALNYGPLDETREQQISVWVSTDFKNDARKATWTQVPWNKWDGSNGVPDANSWTFYNSGRMDLSPWNGQTIYIGFRYKTEDGQTCPTWEVKNLLVSEPAE